MAKNKEPKSKIKKLVKQYEDEYSRVLPLLESEDNVVRATAENDLYNLHIDSGFDHSRFNAKAHKRRKFALFGTIGSVIGSALLGWGAFYLLKLGTIAIPGMVVLSTATVALTCTVGFGLIPLIMSFSARKKAKYLTSIATKSKLKYNEIYFAKENVNTKQAELTNNTNQNTKVNLEGEELVYTENLGAVNNAVKTKSKSKKTLVTDNLVASFANTSEKVNELEQEAEKSAGDIANNDEITQQSDDENIDDEYSGKSRELTYEELAKEVQGWKFVMKDYKKNPKTKYKCRVELKQYGEKKSGPITSKVLNIVEDDITKFVEQLKNLCDKKSNANKLATARKLCKSAKAMGLKAELRLVMTDMNNPKKTLRTVYKNEEDFVASLETLGRQSAIDNMYYTLSALNTQQLEVPKTYPTLENQDATQTKVDEQTNSDTITPNSYVDISKDEIEFEF